MNRNLILLAVVFSFSTMIARSQTNYALSLNGTTDYVSIGAPLPTGSSYTKEAWVYTLTGTGFQNILSSSNTPFWINNGVLSAGQAGGYQHVFDLVSFPTNTWVHVAVTYDAPSTTMRLYRNGILISSSTSVPGYTSENNFIGSHQSGSSLFQGFIDEVRIWNVALTEAQLKAKTYGGPANDAAGLVAYYKCNDGSGTVLTSSCTNTSGLDGTLQGSTAWSASPVKFGRNAVSFDGIDDAINIPDASSLDIVSAITIEAWCYATNNAGIQNVISKSSNSTNNGYIFPRTDDGWANVVMYMHIAGGWRTLSAPFPSLNTWHHLAATYDGAMLRLYINGVLANSQARTGNITSNANLLALGNQTGFSEFFEGSVDEVRIWNVARTQAEIQYNMNKELDPVTQTGLVSYYIFNQGNTAGTNTGLETLIDQKGNNNGTLVNFALSGSSSNFVSQKTGFSVLPVSLLDFTAGQKDKTVLLKWRTASEQSSSEFIIQHSGNGMDWNNAGMVAAAGNSNSIIEYSYVHTQPISGLNYYRLLQTDIDDRGSYSSVRVVKFINSVSAFTVLNNPVTNGMLQVKLNYPATLSLYDSKGSIIWRKQGNTGIMVVNMGGHAKGLYMLKTDDQIERVVLH